MKTIEIKGSYIIKTDLKVMLEKLIKEVDNNTEGQLIEVESNLGGIIKCEIINHPIEDLREKDFLTQTK